MKPHVIILIITGLAFIPEVIQIIKLFREKLSDVDLRKRVRRFNLIILVTGILMLLVSTLYQVNYINYHRPIPYSNWKSITWKDFTGLRQPNKNLYGSTSFASIVTEIRIKQIDSYHLEICALFHPSRSYVFSTNAGEGLLDHEMCHFHITEYWTRELRKRILQAKSDFDFKELIEEIRFEERAMQIQFDSETDHGYVLGNQKEWKKRLMQALEDNTDYSNCIIKIK